MEAKIHQHIPTYSSHLIVERIFLTGNDSDDFYRVHLIAKIDDY